MANSNDTTNVGGTVGGGGGSASSTAKSVDGNAFDPTTGNAVSGGYKTVGQLTAAVNGASASDKAALATALGLDNLLRNT